MKEEIRVYFQNSRGRSGLTACVFFSKYNKEEEWSNSPCIILKAEIYTRGRSGPTARVFLYSRSRSTIFLPS
jgi:hypothetical protein